MFKEIKMLRPKSSKRAPARKPFLTEGAPIRNDIRPAGARLRERLDRPLGFGEVRSIPPSAVLDKIAEEKITKGFSRRKNTYCNGCGVLQTSKASACFCQEDAPIVPKTERASVACRGCGMRGKAKNEPCICKRR